MTYSGYPFSFTSPSTSYISIEDIAHALSNLCRFTGHCEQFYSVAQHCVNVSYFTPAVLALHGLLHDASEAYLGDVSSPLKEMLEDYKTLEKDVEEAIKERFCLWASPYSESHTEGMVKHADLLALKAEQKLLLGDRLADISLFVGMEDDVLLKHPEPLGPEEAKHVFLSRFYALPKPSV